jgi:hypothetical protein
MKTVGYFEGTDPACLTRLVSEGFGTLPLANGWDGHGKLASHIEPGEVDLIIGYLHKLLPPKRSPSKEEKKGVTTIINPPNDKTPFDLLFSAHSYNIPILIIAPDDCHDEARKLLGEAIKYVEFVTSETLCQKALEKLGK